MTYSISASLTKRAILVVLLLIVSGASSGATVIVDRFGPSGSIDCCGTRSATTPNQGNPPADGDQGRPFTIPTGQDYLLTTIDLGLRRLAGSNSFDLWVVGNDPTAGEHGAPDTTIVLESFSATGLLSSSAPTVVSLDSVVRPTLVAGELYWLVLSVSEPNTAVGWYSAPISLMPRPAVYAERFDNAAWEVRLSETGPGAAYRVTGSPVPIPPAAWLFGSAVALGLAAFRRRKQPVR